MAWLIEETKPLSRPPALPPKQSQIGNTTTEWFESEPGVAVIICTGGTIDDRWLAECVIRENLAACGIRQAKFSFDQTHRTAAWDDIMEKAKRLIQAGNVTLLRNGYNNVVAHVVGDHGEYQSEISRNDPNSRVITQWTCECPWDQFAFQRTRKWKKYEARPCAHVLATYWKSLGTPLDEQLDESQIENMGTGQKLPGGPAIQGQPPGSTFGPSGAPIEGIGQTPVEHAYQPSLPVQGQPGQDWGGQMPGVPPMMPGMVPDPTTMAPSQLPPLMAPPGDNQVIPPYPMDPNQLQMPVSVPGGRPGPYPANPLQQPGTLSHVIKVAADTQFVQGMAARINEATLGQSEGREGAYDAGQWMEIPRNARVEVVFQDPTTGWVEVLYPLKGGPMSSYHIRCFVEPEKLTPLPGQHSPFQNPKR
jgi:hypothetical protein